MKVLLTGSHGFVGSAFRKFWVSDQGADLTEVDIIHPDSPWDFRQWCRYNTDAQFDLAIHCAAIVGGRQSIDGSPFSVASNLALDYDFINWARIAKPRKTVLFSSSAVYPNELQTGGSLAMRLYEDLVDLDDIQQPDNSYGYGKLTLEKVATWASIEPLILRPFSGYSHDQSPDYPFRALLERVRAHEEPLNVWSDTVRDFIHIDDIVRAVIAMVNQSVVGPVNLCTGRATSFTDLARMMADAEGYASKYYQKPLIQVLTDMPTGVQYRVGDPELMSKFYTPTITLEEGIRKAFR